MLDNRYVRFVIETGKSSTVAASELAGLDRFTIAAEDGALDSMAYVVVRDGDDLVMLFADGTRVVIEDYFTSTASFAFDGLGQAVELLLDAQPIGTVGDKALYAFSGDIDGARTILLESRGFTALEPLLDDAAHEIIVALDGHSLRGPDGDVTIRPGMQADVELDAGQRTVFQYLFHPLLRAQEAFSEPD